MKQSPPSHFAGLRAKFLDEIKRYELEIQRLRGKLEILSELDVDVGSLVTAGLVTKSGTGRFANASLTHAVRDTVREIAVSRPVTATEVRDYLSAHGYVHPSKNFDVATSTALKRLVGRQLIKTERLNGGRRVYFAGT